MNKLGFAYYLGCSVGFTLSLFASLFFNSKAYLLINLLILGIFTLIMTIGKLLEEEK